MGQMTFALMYGCNQTPPDILEEGWHSLCERYDAGKGPEPTTPHGDGDHDIIGFWVAVGASGEDGVPDLETVALDEVASVYKKSHARAVKAWQRFATWTETQGITMGTPKLHLVETEVA